MTKNSSKIRAAIEAMARQPVEITSGTVLAGSLDEEAGTVTVQPTDDGMPIADVKITSVAGANYGMLLYPDDDSDVVIATVDGPGEWVVLTPGKLKKAALTIGSVSFTMDSEQVNFVNSNTILNMTDSLFKMKTASESLFSLLNDLISYIMQLTVPTPAGNSGVPINVADFNSLISRLNNLLTN